MGEPTDGLLGGLVDELVGWPTGGLLGELSDGLLGGPASRLESPQVGPKIKPTALPI